MGATPNLRIRSALERDRPVLESILRDTFLADHTRYIPEALDPAAVAEATLDTQEANRPAIGFYTGRGYRITRHWLQTRFTRTPIPTVTMAKRLSAPWSPLLSSSRAHTGPAPLPTRLPLRPAR